MARREIGQVYDTYCDHCLIGIPICDKCRGCVSCGTHLHYDGWCSKACMTGDESTNLVSPKRRGGDKPSRSTA